MFLITVAEDILPVLLRHLLPADKDTVFFRLRGEGISVARFARGGTEQQNRQKCKAKQYRHESAYPSPRFMSHHQSLERTPRISISAR